MAHEVTANGIPHYPNCAEFRRRDAVVLLPLRFSGVTMSCINVRSGARAAALGVALAAFTGGAFAQNYPARPVQVIVPYSAGGSIDIITRAVAQALSKDMGQNFVVENRPGASGMIGTELVS